MRVGPAGSGNLTAVRHDRLQLRRTQDSKLRMHVSAPSYTRTQGRTSTETSGGRQRRLHAGQLYVYPQAWMLQTHRPSPYRQCLDCPQSRYWQWHTLAASRLMAKQMKVTTSLTTTTAMTREQKGPLPSVSFSTAICSRRRQLSKLLGSLVLGWIQMHHAVHRT